MKKRCLKEFCGEADERDESREEAFSGMGISSSGGSSFISLRFRLRCGRTVSSCEDDVVGTCSCSKGFVEATEIEAAVSTSDGAGLAVECLLASQLPLQRSLSRKNFFFRISRCL